MANQKPAARKFHPEGVAALVAAIVASGDVPKDLPEKAYTEAIKAAMERRQSQVLRLARVFYQDHPVDFQGSAEWRQKYPKNGLQNLAKLSRRALTTPR